MNPTVGRIVHFRHAHEDGQITILPALVVKVWSPTTLNLQVFNDGGCDLGGNTVLRTSVMQGTSGGEWQWPTREA